MAVVESDNLVIGGYVIRYVRPNEPRAAGHKDPIVFYERDNLEIFKFVPLWGWLIAGCF
jgi:hypothetical protein